jgi:trigger factor
MQVTETVANGLKRELKVIIPQAELGQRFNKRLDEVKDQVQIKGFRPGKVPAAHVKKMYGRSLMAEVLQQALDETSRQAIVDRKERPALQPDIALSEDKDEIEKVMSGKADLSYTMKFEVLPTITLTDMTGLTLVRETLEVPVEEIDKGINELVERSTSYDTIDGREAVDGDQVTIDFVGSVDGVEFPGGKGEGMTVVLGAGNFIPGFEEGLKGAKAGDDRTVTATFPEEYAEKSLAGKTASFATSVKAVGSPKKPTVDDEFAKTLGLESADKLRELVTTQIKSQYDQISRAKLKRQLLDALDKSHTFELPETLVNNEFDGIFNGAKAEMERAGKTFESEGKTEDEAKAEYRKIAERRVRLGLVIGEVGDKEKIQISQDELRGALIQQARQYPGQEKMVYEYYEKNPAALTELRAPLFEEKVVDHILGLAKPTDKIVSREDLFKGAFDDASPVA